MNHTELDLDFEKPPILLLGSGITRRYANHAPNWRELLYLIAERMGISKSRMIAFEEKAKVECDSEFGHLPMLATILAEQFRSKIIDGGIEPSEILSKDEMSEFNQGRADAIKIMAASQFLDIEIKDDDRTQREISLLKKLVNVIPCVVTTNYDRMIEDQILGGKFKVYSKVPDYYLSGSQGIGEVYKIHGSCEDPSTMILNQEDYTDLKKRSKIVTAKILSVLCDYPMLIMGYSLEDADVKGILDDLISSLDDDKLKEVERNIVYISYAPGISDFRESTMNVECGGHRMSLKAIETDDFETIFEKIASIQPSESPLRIRKIRQLVKNVAITSSKDSNNVCFLGIDDITEEDSDKLVIGIATEDYMKALTVLPLYTADTMVEEIMSGESKYNPRAVVDFFMTDGSKIFNVNMYVPIFHYIRESDYDVDSGPSFLKKFIERKNVQFTNKFKLLPNLQHDLKSKDVRTVVSETSGYLRPIVVMYCFDKDLLDGSSAMEMLREMYTDRDRSDVNFKSNFKCALTYISFKEIGLRKESGH